MDGTAPSSAWRNTAWSTKVEEARRMGEGNVWKAILAIAILTAAVASLVFTAPMMWGYGWGCPWMAGPGTMGWGGAGIGWMALWAAFLALLMVGIYLIVTALSKNRTETTGSEG